MVTQNQQARRSDGEFSRTVGHKDGSIGLRSWELNRDSKKGFPDSLVGKESACNAGDSSSIPGSGRSTGEGIGNPL